ncbi:MAG: protein-disulfide reductase DsbD [Candidatus Marinimicrobia bacterium]|nr:protein-disulfide reductase DsbD [Candidatus Neomarinimicrobiota bacterium]
MKIKRLLEKKYLKILMISIISMLLFIGALISETPAKIVNLNADMKDKYIEKGKDFTILLEMNIEKGWHINSNKPLDEFVIPTEVKLKTINGIDIKTIKYPEPNIVDLESLGGKTSTFKGKTIIKINGIIDGEYRYEKVEFNIDVTYQGCNDAMCLAPITKTISLITNVKTPKEIITEKIINKKVNENEEIKIEKEENPIVEDKSDKKISSKIQELKSFEKNETSNVKTNEFGDKGIFLILIVVFFGGLALNLTPCVYPLIPITIGYFANETGKGSSVLKASMYVVGISITYSVLGTIAALSGSMMGSLLTNPFVLIGIAIVMLLLSLSMFGVYEFRLPSGLMNIGSGSQSGAIGSLIMGLTMGIVAAPCVGPFVIGLLTYVAKSGNPLIGFIMFFALSLGLGLPYLFLGIFSNKIGNLPRSGEWLNGVRIFFGLVLVGMAIYFINPLISESIRKYLLPGYMILAGIYYAVIDNSGKKSIWFLKGKVAISIIIIVTGVWLIKPANEKVEELDWRKYSVENIQIADDEDKFVMIDFFADWCIPCKELDELTFSDKKVQEKLSQFILIKADLTKSSEQVDRLRKLYNIKGVPTIIFLDENGNEIKSMRLNGFIKPEKFIERMNYLRK